jgi:hypothetical protein
MNATAENGGMHVVERIKLDRRIGRRAYFLLCLALPFAVPKVRRK